MWAPLLEKAWAKVHGSYTYSADPGFVQNGIRAIAGIPVFTYDATDLVSERLLAQAYELLDSANYQNYLVGASTAGVPEDNACGVRPGHSYSILSAFKMEDLSGLHHRMLLMRDPKGYTSYSGPWAADDPAWSGALLA